MQAYVDRFRAKATKARQAQSRLKALERMETVVPAHVDSPFQFSFFPPGKMSSPLINLAQADIGYGQPPVLHDVGLSVLPDTRIGLLGPNGAGKSSLIKTLAGQLPLLAGECVTGEKFSLGYFAQDQLKALDLNASAAVHTQRLPRTEEHTNELQSHGLLRSAAAPYTTLSRSYCRIPALVCSAPMVRVNPA